MVMQIQTSQIIERYYKDYIQCTVLTDSEFSELVQLFKIIFEELQTQQTIAQISSELMDVLTELRGQRPVLLPIDFSDDEAPDQCQSYLDMLHSRELRGDQRTAEWKQQRHNYITASVSAACAGLLGPAARENQLLEKASYGKYSPFKGGYYTDIGNIFEPVTNSHYSFVNNTRIHDFALIPSDQEEWHFLAASTDGVAVRGAILTNIEIKTLPGRVPDGTIKKVYAHQMQHQMACLGLQHTDFLEAKYEELPELPELPEQPKLSGLQKPSGLQKLKSQPGTRSSDKPIGIIAELWSISDNSFTYEYSPAGASVSELKQWQMTRESIMRGYEDRLFVRWIYWRQTHYSCIRVNRDPHWLKTVGPALKKFYAEMIELQQDQPRVQKMIRDKESRAFSKRNVNNELQHECLI